MGVRVREDPPKSGVFYVFVNLRGRRKAQRIGKRKEDAEYVARAVRKEIASGNFKFNDEVEEEKPLETLREYWEAQLKLLPASLEETTITGYASNLRLHVGPVLGDIPLNQLTREKVKEFVAELVAKGLKKATIRQISADLCAILNRAIEDRRIASNPAARLSRFYKNAKQREEPILPLSKEEVPLFLQAAKKHFPFYFPVFVTFLHTGIRPGELSALRWSDVDLEGRLLTVRSALKRNGTVGKTKTGKVRKIDMSDFLVETLKIHQAEQLQRFNGDLPEWVFVKKGTDGMLDQKNLYHRAFAETLKAVHHPDCKEKHRERRIVRNGGRGVGLTVEYRTCCVGLTHRRLYDLRHSFATLLVSAGESLAYVKDQLGHSSITLTVDTYTHWIPGSNRQAVNKLPGLIPVDSNIRKFKRA